MMTANSAKLQSFIKAIESQNNNELALCGPMPLVSPLSYLRATIFIDGGLNHRPLDFKGASLSLGDGDSVQNESLDFLAPTEKDFSDYAFALNTIDLMAPQIKKIYCHGLLGGRADHEWILLNETLFWLQEKSQYQVFFADSPHLFSKGDYDFSFNGTFSLFCPFEDNQIELAGEIKYPIVRATGLKTYSSHGLSNEAHGDFKINSQKPFMIFWVKA